MKKSDGKRRQGAGEHDATDVLKAQHREVEGLFAQFEEAEDDEAEAHEAALLVCEKLTMHATIEEEIFYPAVRELEGMEDTVLEALEEHQSVKRLVSDIEDLTEGEETLSAKMKVLKEQVEHHVEEEEEDLFPEVKDLMPDEERMSLGERLLTRTQELERGQGDGADRIPEPRSGTRESAHLRHD